MSFLCWFLYLNIVCEIYLHCITAVCPFSLQYRIVLLAIFFNCYIPLFENIVFSKSILLPVGIWIISNFCLKNTAGNNIFVHIFSFYMQAFLFNMSEITGSQGMCMISFNRYVSVFPLVVSTSIQSCVQDSLTALHLCQGLVLFNFLLPSFLFVIL